MNFLHHIFAFNSDSPLLFTQFYFWAFFAIVYAVFALIMDIKPILNPSLKGRTFISKENSPSLQGGAGGGLRLHLRNVFLMAVSWFFYYKTSGLFLLLLLFVTLSDWLIARRIYKNLTAKRSIKAKLWLALSVIFDLLAEDLAIATQRYIEVTLQPTAERHMPPAPELLRVA